MNIQSNQPIGIFDSGVGGLTVANAIKQILPNEDLIYFGDTAHLPYGDKSKESIIHYSKEIGKFLLEKNCKVILMAGFGSRMPRCVAAPPAGRWPGVPYGHDPGVHPPPWPAQSSGARY